MNPFAKLPRGAFGTMLVDPPWRFTNATGKVAPEHKRLRRYSTMDLDEICALPVAELAAPTAHLYLWCPNALLREGLAVMEAWGLHVQDEYRLAQGAQGRRLRWARRRILFSERERALPVRCARQE